MAEKKYSTDYTLLVAILILVAIGIVMVYSASYVVAGAKYSDTNFFLKKHLLRVGIGLAVMAVLSRIDYHHYKRVSKIGLSVAAGLLLYMLIVQPISVKGSVRWLEIGPFSFQTSEFAKFVLVFYLADSLARKQEKLESFTDGYLPQLLIVTGMAILILFEPDFSSAAIIIVLAFIMFYLGNVKIQHLLATGVASIPFFAIAISNSPYRLQRLIGFLQPETDLLGNNYQINQSLISLGSGGIFGVGIGHSKEKLLYLPEPFTDFIFSILGEELGFVGALFVLTLFLILFWRSVHIARRAPDLYGALLASGIAITIVIAALTNISIVCGLLPTTGLPIPFISYGGTSLLCSLAACGVLLNVAHHQTEVVEKKTRKLKKTRTDLHDKTFTRTIR